MCNNTAVNVNYDPHFCTLQADGGDDDCDEIIIWILVLISVLYKSNFVSQASIFEQIRDFEPQEVNHIELLPNFLT